MYFVYGVGRSTLIVMQSALYVRRSDKPKMYCRWIYITKILCLEFCATLDVLSCWIITLSIDLFAGKSYKLIVCIPEITLYLLGGNRCDIWSNRMWQRKISVASHSFVYRHFRHIFYVHSHKRFSRSSFNSLGILFLRFAFAVIAFAGIVVDAYANWSIYLGRGGWKFHIGTIFYTPQHRMYDGMRQRFSLSFYLSAPVR